MARLLHSLVLVHTAETLVKQRAWPIGDILFCSYKAGLPMWLTLLLSSCLILPPPAIYLCKRTMQNKARLELADYEAVSTLSFCFSAIARKLSVQCRHCVCTMIRWHSEFPFFLITLPGEKKSWNSVLQGFEKPKCIIPSKKPLSNYRLSTKSFFLLAFGRIQSFTAHKMYTSISVSWHQPINTASEGALLQWWSLAVTQ